MRIYVAVLLLALCAPSGWSAEAANHPTRWNVHFSPHSGCTEAIVDALGKAKSTVLVRAFSFTSAPIAKALVEAHRRGVKVEVVLDRSQRTEKYSSATFVYNNGIPCFIDAQHAIAHNKVIVNDGQTVITGSLNFTRAAEDNNAENLLVIQDAQMVAKYAQNWEVLIPRKTGRRRAQRPGRHLLPVQSGQAAGPVNPSARPVRHQPHDGAGDVQRTSSLLKIGVNLPADL
jgi:phosphatidylserine/phosphatidylglycerophosphate/cardiolipin synthase-like enzyme